MRVRDQIVQQWRWIALVLILAGILGAIILLIHFTTDVNVRVILSDPAETALLPEYAGWYSYLGILILWTSSVICFVCSKFGSFRSSERRGFVATFGLILGLIAIDDLFMIHEWIGLELAQWTNASDIADARSTLETFVFATYILIGAVWLWRYRHNIWQSPWPVFALGLLGFGGSIFLDLLPYISDAFKPKTLAVETTMAVLEDLLKLAGIGGLSVYGYLIAVPNMRSLQNQSRG